MGDTKETRPVIKTVAFVEISANLPKSEKPLGPAGFGAERDRPKQWSELLFKQQVLIPRRSIACGEEDPTLVRMPRLQDRCQVRTCLRRELNNPDRVVCLRIG
jgi:hypothetical protein